MRAGIVHLGLGGFHRAHMARYTHDLMGHSHEALEWGIVGVGLLPKDQRVLEALARQDGLYSLVERERSFEQVTVVGSVSSVIYGGDSSQAVLQAIAQPTTRIVSMTVTENGYCLKPATKELDFSHPAIVGDLGDIEWPRSVIGILVRAFHERMRSGGAAFTALTCDNMQHNGHVLKAAVLAFAERSDVELARWIETHGRFPGTMVDRITPVTASVDVDELASRYDIEDGSPVFCETFRQWVIEDDFAQGRPAWDAVGAQFVSDVAPYELMKLRLLNASHLAVAGLGRLAGCTYIHDTLEDADFVRYMQALMDRETGPSLPSVPGVDLANYKQTLIARFANPNIKDTCDRVNADAPINLLIDPIRSRLDAGADASLLALALAAWMKRVAGFDDAGVPLANSHPMRDLLRTRAAEGGSDPRPLLSIHSLFGDLIEHEGFVAILRRWLESLYRSGARATLQLVSVDRVDT